MGEVSPTSTVDLLQYLHEALDLHFERLRAARGSLEPSSPVFALEHGLPTGDLDLLKSTVRSAVTEGLRASHRQWWLPFVVYAAESGYDYVGDEYWQSFEQATPGWRGEHRKWIKNWFEKFALEYGGAMPSGAFAATFTIIAWPITHAVLPTYLQRHLAQLLFEFSAALTSDLLDDPVALGSRLARRASTYTERFRIFCQNTPLVGQVAAALLSGEDEPTPYLLPSTLQRIVDGLSEEQQARHWLVSAQRSASRVRGFRSQGATAAGTGSKEQLRASDPRLFLRRDGDWTAYAELPDMTPLADGLPEVYEQLRNYRATVSGGQRPVPPSGLLYPGQEMRFVSWPRPDQPFLQLDHGAATTNSMLAERCRISKGPWWLFRRQESGLAIEVKGKFVRPGHGYVLVGTDSLAPPEVPWLVPTSIDARGIRAYELTLPEQLTEAHEAALRAAGITTVSHVAIRPVGVVAARWDGEGEVEWLAGEPAMLGLRSDLLPKHCRVVVSGATYLLDWAPGEMELLFSLEGLPVGTHELAATLLGDDDRQMAAGSLTITIRDPQVRPEGASAGEGIRMLASPARPTLSELWDERAVVGIDGPLGTDADLRVRLLDLAGKQLAEVQRSIRLPVEETTWHATAQAIRTDARFVAVYDQAESCTISVARDGVGHATLSCERGFQPLRWRFERAHDGRVVATLVDRTDGGATVVEFYRVEEPLRAVARAPVEPLEVPARGGLAIARAGDSTASVILPTNPNELLHHPGGTPEISATQRSSREIQRLAQSHADWIGADLPADAFAGYEQQLVGDAIARAIGSLIGGGHWSSLERKLTDTSDPADHLEDMQKAVGNSRDHQDLASAVAYNLYQWLTPEALLLGFGGVVKPFLTRCGITGRPAAPRFLLMLAGRPGYVASWEPTEAAFLIDRVLESPVLYRAARFAVLGTRALNDADGTARSF